MKRKIIHILCHTLENDDKRNYHIFGNWASRLARNISHYTNKYDHEVWYAVRNLSQYNTFSKNKITYRLFPAKTLFVGLESFHGIISCPLLFEALNVLDPDSTIIQFQGERGSLLHEVLDRFPELAVTIQYHGYGQPKYFDWLERIFITPQEKKHFTRVRHFFVHIKPRISYLTNSIGVNPSRISYQNVGVDFSIFKPRSKYEARKELNLPQNAFILLYVGSMIKSKGVDKIIQAYIILKKTYPELFLLFVGAKKTDPIYKNALKTADKMVGIIDNNLLPLYYNASDVYCFYGDNKTTLYAGIGTAPTEALASNINVISTNLIHLPKKIVSKVGYIPKNFEDFTYKLQRLIAHPGPKADTREIVAPYTSTAYMMKHLLDIYSTIFKNET